MSRRALAPVVGVLFAALVGMGGCGSGGNESLTKSEYVAQANAICKQAIQAEAAGVEKAISSDALEGLKPNSKAYGEQLIRVAGLPPLKRMTGELAALSAPEGEEKKFETMNETFDTALKQVEADPGSALPDSPDPFNEAAGTAARYGIDQCGRI